MNLLGFLIGTAVLWVLTYVICVPIAKALSGGGGSQSNMLPLSPATQTSQATASIGSAQTANQLDEIDSVPTGTFILIHVLVLA